MVKKYSIAEARDNFTSVVHEAEKGAKVELTRRGRPVAVLLGVEDYERLSRPAPRFWEAYEKFRQEFDLVDLGIDPEIDLSNLRDPSPGRDFEW
ncbi:MAG TPA: type II toxin-antitoxin system Phd/YefM family antitoxin [Thermoanaerobaculia bacterium]|nr:type II toxin-antitoxin system Phd/YefM family antitoxin [Thermoanaerobaculia bacterium]